MMNETDEMREARHELELLSANDPAASANMLRHVAAYNLLIAGRRGTEWLGDEPVINAGFRLLGGDENLYAAVTRRAEREHLHIAFDVDDASGPAIGFGLFRVEDDHVVCYGRCLLWSPSNDGRALIVPVGEDKADVQGYFAFRRGQPLRKVGKPLPGDLMAGLRRARSRLNTLLQSDDLTDRGSGGFMTTFRNEGQEVFAEIRRAA
ncbi:hypothetical protein ACM61V_16645 [Sphingomonas sp. TX0543]|uniref:hypothetical protein n=1 Tax=unclassified Sphingomonas TaxID=196159 RepID=UPI0010F8B613|nr:hypothetical protein [Sphingomonas sp. 3P27F8]